jgi:cytoskeletal protein RodZ
LPGDAYAKAFLRTYADFLGLDAKLYVDEYTARFGPRAPEPAPASAPAEAAKAASSACGSSQDRLITFR